MGEELTAYPGLHYFMQCYWNQMGDEVHGSFAQAIADFCASETQAFQRRLSDDLRRADQAGLILEVSDWTDKRQLAFWEDRALNTSDLAEARALLERQEFDS